MLKKIIAALVIFCMLIPLSSVVAADTPSAKPTVEEILDEYHRKSMEAQDASAYSRSASDPEPSLEQQTVDQLTNAGYEAYNVTAENYDAVQDSLQTDLSVLGLDPNSSYIIVVSGEDPSNANDRSSRLTDALLPPHEWEGGSGGGGSSNSEYLYLYNGKAYRLRNLIITASDNSAYGKTSDCKPFEEPSGENYVANVADVALSILLDAISEELHLGTIASLLGLSVNDINSSYTRTSFENVTMFAHSQWTRTFVQVYSEGYMEWRYTTMTQYVDVATHFAGYYYSYETNSYQEFPKSSSTTRIYSPHYLDWEWVKAESVRRYISETRFYDRIYQIEFTCDSQVVMRHIEDF